MKIAFDAQLLEEKEKTGIAWSADYLIKEMVKKKNNELILNYFTKRRNQDGIEGIRKYKKLGFKLNESDKINPTLYRLLWSVLPISYGGFFGDEADVTYFFNYYVPPRVKGRVITMIHDMVCKDCPETMNFKTKIMLGLTLKKSVKRADLIVTVSEFSKRQIIKHLGVEADKIVVMPNGVDMSIYRNDFGKERIEECKKKYSINEEYFLYLGTLEPRKNIERIVEGYHKLTQVKPDAPVLVLAGRKGWLYESIFEKVKQLNIEDRVIFTGYIDGGDAAPLMCGARAFVFPSLYEGFGMPPLEAMACGTPVLTANTTSLPEVVGDCGILVDPLNSDEIAEGLKRLTLDDELCEDLAKRGYERAKSFSWERAAGIIEDACKRLIEE